MRFGLSYDVKQQRHRLFAGLRSSSKGSGHQRNASVWKAANRSSRPSRPSSTSPVRAAWRASSWECLTGTQSPFCSVFTVFVHVSMHFPRRRSAFAEGFAPPIHSRFTEMFGKDFLWIRTATFPFAYFLFVVELGGKVPVIGQLVSRD